MAAYSVSIHCQLGVKVLFDRICSVPIHTTLLDLFETNIETVAEVDGVKLNRITVAETKSSSSGSEVESTEVVGTLRLV